MQQKSDYYTTTTGMIINPVRASFKLIPGVGSVFKPFNVASYQPLKSALDQALIDTATNLMVFEVGQQTLTLVMKQMAYHHVAQGHLNGQAWVAFFCAGCNMGSYAIPVVRDRIHHFRVTGIYNGMSVMSDYETDSSWEHITGECISGPLQGSRLATQSAQYMNAEQVLDYAPQAQIAISKPSGIGRLLDSILLRPMTEAAGYMFPPFRLSMTQGDNRLPELELGLGIWIGRQARFYPLRAVKANDNALTDVLNKQQIVVYMDPIGGSPVAHRSASPVQHWDGDTLVLESGERIRNGYVTTNASQRCPLDTPYQQIARWYGFSYMFPECEIFSANP